MAKGIRKKIKGGKGRELEIFCSQGKDVLNDFPKKVLEPMLNF
jgi:hypothetical protein